MAGVVLIEDLFTGIASGTSITGRVAPISDSGIAYAVDPANWSNPVTADGSGNVKFNYSGCAVKTRSLVTNYAPSIIFNDGGAQQTYQLFVRDSASTPYPRYGFQAVFTTRYSGDSGRFYAARIDNYNSTVMINTTLVNFNLSGDNNVAFQVSGSTFKIYINGVSVGTFTDTTYPNNTALGFGGNGDVSHAGRVRSFTVYDSIIETVQQQYTVVRFA